VDVENVSNGLRWRRLEPKKRLKRPAVRVRALVEGVQKLMRPVPEINSLGRRPSSS
jgi:hypothetical protein